jgi:hypothetical protein
MGIKIGDLDIANEIIDVRFQLTRTQLILDKLIQVNPRLIRLDANMLKEIDDKALQMLQEKFPHMGIQKR